MKPMTLREEADILSATADQLRTADSIGRLENAHFVEPQHHPWVAGLGERVLSALSQPRGSRMCRHLGRRGPEAMFGEFVRTSKSPGSAPILFLYCRDCLMSLRPRPRYGLIEDLTCDRCSIYARGLALGALPIGPLLLSFGVCQRCADELGLNREQVPA